MDLLGTAPLLSLPPELSLFSALPPARRFDREERVLLTADDMFPDYSGGSCECDMLSLCSNCLNVSSFAFEPSPPLSFDGVALTAAPEAEPVPVPVPNPVSNPVSKTQPDPEPMDLDEPEPVVSARPKRSTRATRKPAPKKKRKRRTKKRSAGTRVKKKSTAVTAETIARADDGTPLLPVNIGGMFRLLALGELVPGVPARWRVHSVPMPVGFTSERQFHSLADPSKKVWWKSEVLRAQDGTPIFKVTDPLAPERPFIDTSMGRVWTTAAKTVRELQNRSTKSVLSGPKCFGFDRPIVRDLINEMVDGSVEQQRNVKRMKRLREEAQQ